MIDKVFLESEIRYLKELGYSVSHAHPEWFKEYLFKIQKIVPSIKVIECYFQGDNAQIIYIPDHKGEQRLIKMLEEEAKRFEKRAESIRKVIIEGE